MLMRASRRRFLRRHLPAFALLAGTATGLAGTARGAMLAVPTLTDGRGGAVRPLPGPAAGADLVLVDNWILRRSDLEHLG